MKIAILSDAHLNKSIYKSILNEENTSLPFRTVDFMNAFEWDIDKIIEMKPDLFVLVGDTFDTFEPSSLVSGFFNKQISKLRQAKIPVIILIGNHDICRRHHALIPLKELRLTGVKIIQSPETIKWGGQDDLKMLMFFPFSMEVEKQDIAIKDQFIKFIEDNKEEIKKTKAEGKEIFFFGHFGVRGAVLNQYSETIYLENKIGENDFDVDEVSVIEKKKSYVNNNKNDISLEDLESIGASYIFLGDYHKHQILKTKKCISMYTGSVEKTDLSEKDQKKGFIFYDSDKLSEPPYGKCRFIEYPHCRPMIEFKGNITQIQKAIDNTDDEEKGGNQPIVRLVFVGNKSELDDFASGLETLKARIKEKLKPIYVYHIQKVTDEEEQSKATAIEAEILEKGHMSSDDVIDVVNEIIDERVSDEEESKILKSLSLEIYKETLEG